MKDSESTQVFFTKVSGIVNQIKCYGDTIPDKKIVEKTLRSLPPKYDHVAAAIEESKDLSTLSLHELIGSLEAHEKRINRSTEQSVEQAFQSKVNSKEKEDKQKGGQFQKSQNGRNKNFGRRNSNKGGNSFNNQQQGSSPNHQEGSNSSNNQQGSSNSNNQNGRSSIQCYICNKYGIKVQIADTNVPDAGYSTIHKKTADIRKTMKQILRRKMTLKSNYFIHVSVLIKIPKMFGTWITDVVII